jgi:hypothetical protein
MSEEQTTEQTVEQEPAETSSEIKEKEGCQKEGCQKEGCQEDHFSVVKFFDLKEEDTVEQADLKIEEKLGIKLSQMQGLLSEFVLTNAEELTLELPNLSPMGDYGKMIEDNDGMTEFLKAEGHKAEHWKLFQIEQSPINKSLLSFSFNNMAVDDGNTLIGFVYASKSGKIRHSFVKVEQ